MLRGAVAVLIADFPGRSPEEESQPRIIIPLRACSVGQEISRSKGVVALSKVYFVNMRCRPNRGMQRKLAELGEKVGLKEIISEKDMVAVKTHMGEAGCTAFVPVMYVRAMVEEVKKAGGRPFVSDSNTLYVGGRATAVNHLRTAAANGFTMGTVGAPIIIADGLKGHDFQETAIEGDLLKSVKIASAFCQADAYVVISHLTGHEYMGFGGALKNVGMGMSSRGGKQQMHSDTKPAVNKEKCNACAQCLEWCPAGAISMEGKGREKHAKIDLSKCIGCGECTVMCFKGAIQARLKGVLENAQRKVVEYCMGALKGKGHKAAFLNFLMNITPACDCWNYNDAPVVEDIGILASRDIVAIDQASLDLLNRRAGRDVFREIYPGVDCFSQIAYAEKMGLGSREYELINLDD